MLTPSSYSSIRAPILLVICLCLLFVSALTHQPDVNSHSHSHPESHNHHHEHHDHHDHHGHKHDHHAHSHAHSHSHASSSPITSFLTSLLQPLHSLPASTAAYTASILVSSASLISLLILPLTPFLTPFLLPFALGALLTDLFHHLLPQIFTPPIFPQTTTTLLFSILTFFLFDCILHLLHPHTHSTTPSTAPAYINLLADALHNFCDGLAIAAAFLSSPSAGIATTLAIILHELPQELADYAVLLRAGFSKTSALFANLLCATTALLGTAVALTAVDLVKDGEQYVTPFAAGAMLYMTFVAVVPEVVKDVTSGIGGKRGGVFRFFARFCVALFAAAAGVWVVGLVEQLHDH